MNKLTDAIKHAKTLFVPYQSTSMTIARISLMAKLGTTIDIETAIKISIQINAFENVVCKMAPF